MNRLHKALNALDQQGVNNARVARRMRMTPTALYRLKVEERLDRLDAVMDAVRNVETEYAAYIQWDESSDNYIQLRKKEVEGSKIGLDASKYFDSYEIISTDIQKNNRKTVRIIDTWLPFVNNEGVRYLREWIANTGEQIQILLLHPNSEALRLRILGLPKHKSLPKVQEALLDNLKVILKESNKPGSTCTVEVRLYDQIPALNAYILDDTVHFGQFFFGGYSQNYFYIHAENNFVVEDINNHFTSVWEHDTTEKVDDAKIRALEEWLRNQDVESDQDPILRRFSELGPWALYYPERYPHDFAELREHDFLNSIGKGVFTISEDPLLKGRFVAQLKTSEIDQLTGSVVVTKVREVYYLNCILALSSGHDIQLNLLIRVSRRFPSETNQLMTGLYNIVYLNQNLGCGLVALQRESEPNAAIFDPMATPESPDYVATLHPAMIFKDSSSLLWNRDHKPCSHAGVYEIFTYGRQRYKGIETKCVIRSMIRIHNNGYTEFVGIFPHGKAYGKVQLILNNLYCDLKNSSQEATRDRRGFFILATREEAPHVKDVYGGIFSGLSADRLPLAKRAIARFLGNDDEVIKTFNQFTKGERIRIFSKKYDALDPAIRDALTGRLTNYIGFQLYNRRFINVEQLADLNKIELPLAQIFLESALYRILHAQQTTAVRDILLPLKQAVQHGLRDLATFEHALKGTAFEMPLLDHADYKNLKKVMESDISDISKISDLGFGD